MRPKLFLHVFPGTFVAGTNRRTDLVPSLVHSNEFVYLLFYSSCFLLCVFFMFGKYTYVVFHCLALFEVK